MSVGRYSLGEARIFSAKLPGQARIPIARHVAHAAGTDKADNFIWAEFGTRRKGMAISLIPPPNSAPQ